MGGSESWVLVTVNSLLCIWSRKGWMNVELLTSLLLDTWGTTANVLIGKFRGEVVQFGTRNGILNTEDSSAWKSR